MQPEFTRNLCGRELDDRAKLFGVQRLAYWKVPFIALEFVESDAKLRSRLLAVITKWTPGV